MNLSVVWRGIIFWIVYLRTSDGVWTNARVPGVAGVAVRVTGSRVDPTPVGVKHNRALESLAAAALRALLDSEGRVGFSREGTGLLSRSNSEESEVDEGCVAEHFLREPGVDCRPLRS